MIKEIAKINIAGEKSLFDKVMETLHSLGNVEIAQTKEASQMRGVSATDEYAEKLSKISYKIAQANFAVKFLEREKIKLKKERKKSAKTSLREMILKPKIKITGEGLNELIKSYNWEEIVAECEKIKENINNAENTVKMLEEKISELMKWKGLTA